MRSLLQARPAGHHPGSEAHLVPIHPESVPGDAACVRWIVPDGTFAVAGRVVSAPGLLGNFLHNPQIKDVIVEPGGGSVLVRCADPDQLGSLGSLLRRALQTALAKPASWQVLPASGTCADADRPEAAAQRDALVRAAAGDILAGRLGDYIRSHGGALRVAEVRDGVVTVDFQGMCRGCPISPLTLHLRFERELRERCPELVAVRSR